jgi:hypothetical protein
MLSESIQSSFQDLTKLGLGDLSDVETPAYFQRLRLFPPGP